VKKILKYLSGEWLKSFKLEKRSFERKDIHQKLIFIIISTKAPEKTSSQQEAEATDISEQGLSMLVDHLRYDDLHIWKDDSFMEPNYLRLAFHLPGTTAPIEADAVVVNFSLAGPRAMKRYKIGVRFKRIAPEALISIRKFLG
jgi:hypothetical protein